MNTRFCWAASASLGSIVLAGISSYASAATIYPTNDGFEVPNFTGTGYTTTNSYTTSTSPASSSDAYDYSVPSSIAAWTFAGGTGIANNRSGFGVNAADNGNSDGTTSPFGQAAFIQGGNGTATGSAFSETVSGFVDGTADINLKIEARDDDQDPVTNAFIQNVIDVELDGAVVGSFSTSSRTFVPETTLSFPVTAGSHVLSFVGEGQGAGNPTSTAFIDSVSIDNSSVPEPATLGLLGISGISLLARRRRA